ncbi:MAG: cysteine desulfurase [Candidatus Aenigmatarchaeota archaeon]|nr:cysteine desulfurase [Candidatus Aenigmarchaeota archaeon]
MSMQKYIKDFPILKRKVNGKKLVYLDSAATSQKPIQVIKAITDFYMNHNANIHRALHTLSEEATIAYEQAREKVAAFINAESTEEIIFVRNTTEALNFASFGLRDMIKKDDKILTTTMEHHSNLIPWQQLAKMKKAKLDFVDFDKNGYLDMKMFDKKVNDAKIVAVTQASNVLGTINPIKKIAEKAKQSGSIIVVDGAQSVPHMTVDVQELQIDMLGFSGHKMLGPTGIGVLYARKELLEKMQPVLFGSDMIKYVSLSDAEWNDLPYKFEYGTSHIAGAIGLGAAIDYLTQIRMKEIRKHDIELTRYALKKVGKIATIYGPKKAEDRSGLIAFNLANIHPHDIAAILNQDGIAIRSGHHCAMPLHERLKISASARASFYLYNTKKEIDLLLKSLQRVKEIFS